MRHTDWHRRLGVAGVVLAGLMTVVAYFTAIEALHRGRISAEFFAGEMTTVLLFPALVAAAVIMRRNPEAHKRLMMIGTTELLLAPVGRWPIVRAWGAFGSYAVTDLFILALLVYDILSRRPHPVTVWAGAVFIASQPLRQMLGGTATWLAFVHWLTS
jgi:hypothetical protein